MTVDLQIHNLPGWESCKGQGILNHVYPLGVSQCCRVLHLGCSAKKTIMDHFVQHYWVSSVKPQVNTIIYYTHHSYLMAWARIQVSRWIRFHAILGHGSADPSMVVWYLASGVFLLGRAAVFKQILKLRWDCRSFQVAPMLRPCYSLVWFIPAIPLW